MNYDAVIFDLDGTLWNANKSCTIAWNNCLDSLNYNKRITEDEMDSVTGKPFEECIDILLPDIKLHVNNIAERITEAEKEIILNRGGIIYPNVIEGIQELSSHCKIFIVSNCEQWYLQKFIEQSNLASAVTDWYCYGATNQEKHVMITNVAYANKFSSYVYIGDTCHDKKSSDLSGAAFIQMTYGFGAPIEKVIQFNDFKKLTAYLNPENC